MRDMTPAQKLHHLIQSRGWDKKQLLTVIPFVSATTVYNWLKGEGTPSLKAALAIAREFDVSMEWLADDEKDFPPDIDRYAEAKLLASKMIETLGLTENDVMSRLASPGGGKQDSAASPPGSGPVKHGHHPGFKKHSRLDRTKRDDKAG